MNPEKEILSFIKERFSSNCNWDNGNCYYFAVILKERFKTGEIYYSISNNHFIFRCFFTYYDWKGVYYPTSSDQIVPWDDYKYIDYSHYMRIIRDCIL